MEAKELISKLDVAIKEYGGIRKFVQLEKWDHAELNKYVNHPDYPMSAEEVEREQKLLNAVGALQKVREERTGDDMDMMEYIFHFTDHDIYLRVFGSYSSWDGVDFYDPEWIEVKPRQVMTTIYEVVR